MQPEQPTSASLEESRYSFINSLMFSITAHVLRELRHHRRDDI
jgi:hypothetical protein